MNDHDQQARASENFAGPVDFETLRPDLPVHFLNFQKPQRVKKVKQEQTFIYVIYTLIDISHY